MTGSEGLQQIRAVLRIQWLSVKNSARQRSERIGLIVSTVVAILWYSIWTATALLAGYLAVKLPPAEVVKGLPLALLFVVFYWQFAPLMTASMGVSLDLRKMALFPVDVNTLFAVECLLRLMTGMEMVLVVGGLSIGMTLRAPGLAPVFWPAVLLFLLFNVLLSAGLRNLLERLLQRRRLREIFVFLVVMASVAPQFVLLSGSAGGTLARLRQIFRFLPQALLPSTSLARIFVHRGGAADWMVLASWCAAAGVFGYLQFRRAFYADGARGRRGGEERAREGAGTDEKPALADRFCALPSRWLRDPLAALVEKELRYLLRSPRFRLLFVMGFSFAVVAWLPFGMRRSLLPEAAVHESFLAMLSLYALLMIGQVTFLNSFGFDRAAARYFFWMPVPPATLLLAKNMASEMFVLLETVMLTIVCLLLREGVTAAGFVEAVAVTAISSLYVFSAGNFASVLFPSALTPERVSRGAGRGIQGLFLFLYPLAISPVIAAYLVRYLRHSMEGFVLLLAVAAAGGLALYATTLRRAAALSCLRRESLLAELSRGEGPVVSD